MGTRVILNEKKKVEMLVCGCVSIFTIQNFYCWLVWACMGCLPLTDLEGMWWCCGCAWAPKHSWTFSSKADGSCLISFFFRWSKVFVKILTMPPPTHQYPMSWWRLIRSPLVLQHISFCGLTEPHTMTAAPHQSGVHMTSRQICPGFLLTSLPDW